MRKEMFNAARIQLLMHTFSYTCWEKHNQYLIINSPLQFAIIIKMSKRFYYSSEFAYTVNAGEFCKVI